jgi:hypothetical protein
MNGGAVVRKIAVLLLTLFLAACTASDIEEDDALIEGLIYSKSESAILVIADIDDVDLSEEEWYGNEAIYFSVNEETRIEGEAGQSKSADDLLVGTKVKVWSTGPVAESYPMQATASRIVVVEP